MRSSHADGKSVSNLSIFLFTRTFLCNRFFWREREGEVRTFGFSRGEKKFYKQKRKEKKCKVATATTASVKPRWWCPPMSIGHSYRELKQWRILLQTHGEVHLQSPRDTPNHVWNDHVEVTNDHAVAYPQHGRQGPKEDKRVRWQHGRVTSSQNFFLNPEKEKRKSHEERMIQDS